MSFISFPILLLLIASLTFLTSWLLVKRFFDVQAKQMRAELLKSRIGLASRYGAEHLDLRRRCWWCSIGQSLGPKSNKELTIIRRQLVSAGYRRDSDLGSYFFIKYMLILTSGLISAFLWSWMHISPVWVIALPIVFLLLPERYLIYLGQKRLNKISMHLPDFLDMCNICMNAGLSYLVAVKRVSKELKEVHPEICYEFEYLLDQIQIGVPRVDALRQFAERNSTNDIQSLIQVLIQNEKLGSSIGESLNDFSRRMYQDREQQMEEKANKTSAKMAIVILPFLMVPYLILLLGEKMVMIGRSF